MELLRRYDVELEGAEAVAVGRSDLVGKPLAALLLAANATVTVCHSRTRDLAAVCRRADVLVAAVGVPRQAVAFIGGYAFGAMAGTALALVAQLLGCAASFYWARAVALASRGVGLR